MSLMPSEADKNHTIGLHSVEKNYESCRGKLSYVPPYKSFRYFFYRNKVAALICLHIILEDDRDPLYTWMLLPRIFRDLIYEFLCIQYVTVEH